MPKEEWGVKRLCPTTGKRFYDLNKTPIVSPYTGEVVELSNARHRTIIADSEDAATKKAKAADAGAGAGADTEVVDDGDVDVDLDDDLLEDDEDDDVSLDDIADVAANDDDD